MTETASETLNTATNGLTKDTESTEQEMEVEDDSNSSDSSDSDDDSKEEEHLQLKALETALAENPSDYDSHVKYIKSLRKLGEIEKLRQARETMSELFPLSPEMWQEWANDEATLSSGNEDFAAISKLYERGVHDYLSVSLWCDYINFVEKHDPLVCECSPLGITKMRELFERAVPAVGLHVTEGSRIWQAYIKYEKIILDAIGDSNTEEKEKQVQRIRSIFIRQLSVPLQDSRSTFLAYKSWEAETGGSPSHVSSAYEKAVEMYNKRAQYEEQILRQAAPEEKLQSFMTYLKFEQSNGDPARVQILYERAVTDFPVSRDIWLAYTRYLDDTLKVAESLLDVYSRATRNCTWVAELWVHYLLALERARASEEELSNVFEKSLHCVFSTYEEYLDLFLTRIDGFRRRICSDGSVEDSLDYSVIRDTFQRATDFLSPNIKNTDGLLQLHSYWARLELNHVKDLVAVRGVWESLLKTSGSMLEAWKQYIAMEIERGHIDEARRIYKRCYHKKFAGSGSEDICHAWVRFEREHGTLEDYDHAVRKVTPRLEELQLFRSQQESKSGVASVASKELSKKTPQKRKMGARSTDEDSASKRLKGSIHKPTSSYEKETNRKLEDESNVGSGKPVAVKPETRNEQQIEHSSSTTTYNDQCTAFLINVSLKATDEDLRAFFSDVGGVTAIRILKDKFTGTSRGLAYVDFSDDAHLAAALTKNGQILLGKEVSVNRSDPKRSKKKEISGRSTGERDRGELTNDTGPSVDAVDSQKRESVASHTSTSTSDRSGNDEASGKPVAVKPETSNEQPKEHSNLTYSDQCTAFLSSLNLRATDEDLRSFFSDIGGVTSIRLLKDKYTGKSRGLAYVDFSDDAHLAAALKKNKRPLLGKGVSIRRSDPSRSKRQESSRGTNEHGSDSQKKGAGNRGENNVKLTGKNTFAVPRTLARPLGWSKNEPKQDEEMSEVPKSNDEFRNLLLKK